MSKMLINATQRDELRSVIIDAKNTLINLDVDSPQQEQKKSNIYKAVVTSIEPSLGALFVNFGSERTGFLPFSNISPEYYNQEFKGGEPDLRSLFTLGQELVVQVEKDERGNKGAALTTYISLAGSYCVLMPNNARGGGISRQIEGKDREMLQEKIEKINVPEGMGLIIRTAGVHRSADELGWDLKILLRYWDAIKQAAIAKPGPYLIHQESSVVLRSVRDNLKEDITEVIIDDQQAYQEVYDYINLVRPEFLDRIKLHQQPTSLFSYYQIENQIEMAYQHELQLPSGGSIVIDHTEALISIDVNSARATKGGNIEETALQTNLEAADEVARQLRIRDLGGLIVIDFIDMTPIQNKREVENRLRDALKMDRARIQTERISRFGLLEMSRQRLRRALSKTMANTCPRCKGQGMIQSVESLANLVIHRAEQELAKASNSLQITVQSPTDLASYLLNECRDRISKLEKEQSSSITIVPNQFMETPDYSFKVRNTDSGRQSSSYTYINDKKPKPSDEVTKQATKTFDEPVMNQYLSIPETRELTGNEIGLFKRLITRVFGDEKEIIEENPVPTKKKPTNNRSRNGASKTSKARSTDNRKPRQSNKDSGPSTGNRNRRKKDESDKEQSREGKQTRRGTRGGSRQGASKQAQTENKGTPRRNNRAGNKQANKDSKPINKDNKTAKIEPTVSAASTANKPRATDSLAAKTQSDTAPLTENKSDAPAAPAKRQRRSLSSAKQASATRSRGGGGSKAPKPVSNPVKKIKPRD